MSLLLLFNQSAVPIGSTVGGGGQGYNRREVDRVYDEWKQSLRRVKPKKAKKTVEAAIEVLEEAKSEGLLTIFQPAIQLSTIVETIPMRPPVVLLSEMHRLMEAVRDALDEEDDDDVILMLWALQ